MGYARSPFRGFESYLRNVYGLNFLTYQIQSGIYSIDDISKIVFTMGHHERTLQIEYDDIGLKTKLFLNPFCVNIGYLEI